MAGCQVGFLSSLCCPAWHFSPVPSSTHECGTPPTFSSVTHVLDMAGVAAFSFVTHVLNIADIAHSHIADILFCDACA